MPKNIYCDTFMSMAPGPKPKHTESMSLRLEPELRKILLELAEREDRTPSQMARILLREAVEARKPVAVREKKR